MLQILGLIFLLAAPDLTQAADVKFQPQINIPVKDFEKAKDPQSLKAGTAIGYYIQSIYKYAIGIVGILAAVVLMFGGIVWLTAGGNQTRIGEAKAWIGASLTGLVIALTSYMILWTVNPALVQFRPIVVREAGEGDTGAENDSKEVGEVTSDSKCCIESATLPKYCKNIPSGTPCNDSIFPPKAKGRIFYIASGNKKCAKYTISYTGATGYQCSDK
jgi:hypothetical protein